MLNVRIVRGTGGGVVLGAGGGGGAVGEAQLGMLVHLREISPTIVQIWQLVMTICDVVGLNVCDGSELYAQLLVNEG